jgi:hypothetical protein
MERMESRTLLSPPTVTGLNPTSGPVAGGTSVTISGTNFTGATAVDFGTTAVGNFTVVNNTTITTASPAGTGTVNVTVTNPDGTSPTSAADQFTYLAAPTVTALSPTSGTEAGGTPVTITGTAFTGATAVDFGTTAATHVNVVNATTITANSPAGTGTVDVTVVTPGGSSATSPADHFTYTPVTAPAVTALSPTSGTQAGGTPVTITGSGFTGATAVDFGTTAATHVNVVNDTSITADSPAGTGTVDVRVTTPAGTSATSPADQFTYTAVTAPAVTALSPTSGPEAGGTSVTITGTGFTGATAVNFGTTAATNLNVVNDTSITATSPAGTGTVDVTVTTPAGTSPTSPADHFSFIAAPTVTALSPTSGTQAGGTPVTITGTNFTGATAVDFGTTAATHVNVVNATTITANSPAGTGTVDVTVVTPGGTSATSPADHFTYTAVTAPAVTALSPTSGPVAGGTSVTITGTGFTGATAVNFGTTAATNVNVVNDTSITATSPAGTGTVDVTVTTPAGTSATSPADHFTFTAVTAPVVTALSPTSGTQAGGTPVTITGSGFTGATAVDFGTTAATHVNVVSDTSITANSPAGTGTVDVTVTTPAGTSATSPADRFTYTAVTAPAVTALSPTSGPEAGGTSVTITGSGFTGATAVDFGTTAATNVNVVNDNSITATSPAGTGTVDVTVTTPAGTSPTSTADQFTYTAVTAPAVTALNPTSGPEAGGTSVTITGSGFTGATAVDFGTTPATNVNVVSDTSITATSPAGTGTVDVTVTTPAGTSPTTTADQFTFTSTAAPTISGLSPTSGPETGGTVVTISGAGFTGATAVDFGTTPAASFTVVDDTTITAATPAGTGVVDMTVTTPNGTSATSPADQFTFTAVAAPTVVSVQRFGFHMQQTSLVLTFSSALAPGPAENVNNYEIMTSSGTLIPVSSAVYNASALTVTLVPSSRLDLHKVYQLTVNGMPPNGLTSDTGVPLDGAGSGTPGTNFVTMISGANLAGPDPTLLRTNPARFALEQKFVLPFQKQMATQAELRKLAAASKNLALVAEKVALAHKKPVAQVRHVKAPAASAVDHVLHSGTVSVNQIAATRQSARHRPRG